MNTRELTALTRPSARTLGAVVKKRNVDDPSHREPNMTTPYDHNQLATLSALNIEYDRDGDRFYYEQIFDFENSVDLNADAVAETWRGMFEQEEQYDDEGTDVDVEGTKLTIRMEYKGVNTRHGLKRMLAMMASEMVMAISTHDTEQAVGLAEELLENAEDADDLIG